MAGHNKWSKVKHIKGAIDAKRGKMFSKLSRELTVAAREGGGDPDMNARLRSAITAAKAQNMPNDTIERAIKKGTGELAGESLEEALYEGYAPGGVACLVEVVTDNKNRVKNELNTIFNKGGGSLGSSGSVAFQFDRKGEIKVAANGMGEEEMLERALEAGAEDVASDEDEHTVTTAPEQLAAVAAALAERGVEIASQQLVFIPQNLVPVPDAETAAKILRLYEKLDDYDDTQNVFSNFDIPDDVMEQVEF